MPLREFNLPAIQELDGGKIAIAFGEHLKRAALDCNDRPGDRSPRSVELKATLKPTIGEDGDLEDVKVEFEVKSKTPVQRSRVFSMDIDRQGRLKFNIDSPDDVDQRTLLKDE
jgi:hypothetical protein